MKAKTAQHTRKEKKHNRSQATRRLPGQMAATQIGDDGPKRTRKTKIACRKV